MHPSKRRTLATVLGTAAATLVALAVIGVVVIYAGLYNAAATDEHSALVRWALQTTAVRSMKVRAKEVKLPKLRPGSPDLLRAFRAFDGMCVQCHGAPGVERSWLGRGIQPRGPDLSASARHLTPAAIHWAIEHGFKFTGMPGLAPTHSEDEIRELTAFVVLLGDMTAEAYQDLGKEARPEEQDSGAEAPKIPPESGDGHPHHRH